MFTRLSRKLLGVSRGWVVLVALVIFAAFLVFVLPRQPRHPAGSPDTSFLYSADELYAWAEAYGPDGRHAYVEARYTFDLAWPVVYAFFLTTSLSWLTWRGFAPGSIAQRANLVPLLGMLFDLLENLSTAVVMQRYPQLTPAAAGIAPGFTALKWILVGGSFVLLVVAAAAAARRRVRRQGLPT